MNSIMKLVQGTPEWHAHRAQYRNASETAAVMGLSPWQTPYDLWLVKTGRKIVEETEAIRHGTAMEPVARHAFEEATGFIMQPKVMVNGVYSASLDGITMDGSTLVEIKCPFKGQSSELWQTILSGKIPEHYRLQVQHQLMVSLARLAYLWVFDGNHGIKVPIEPDEPTYAQIQQAWDAFQTYLDSDIPPPLSDQDTFLREDAAWSKTAREYLGWKSLMEDAAAKADKAKARLVELTTHTRESGVGVTVTHYWKHGSIDYKRIPALKGIDLEPYRGKIRKEVRVTTAT